MGDMKDFQPSSWPEWMGLLQTRRTRL